MGMELLIMVLIWPALLLVFSISAAADAVSTFTPADSYFLDCGSSSNSSDPDLVHTFVPDSPFIDSHSNSETVSNSSAASGISAVYSTARIFTSTTTYQFIISPQGIGTHAVRLHFFPFSAGRYQLSSARFNVTALQSPILSDFSVEQSAGRTVMEFFLWVDPSKQQQFTITFSPTSSSSFAFVNAVEFFSLPAGLINASNPRYLNGGPGKSVDGFYTTLETIYRVNVGGSLFTPFNDSLWRRWVTDVRFLSPGSLSRSVEKSTTEDSINYKASLLCTKYVAPPGVYSTSRSMNIDDAQRRSIPNFNFNVTWTFPVTSGDQFFVRLHFCDLVADMNLLYFNVYLNDLAAYSELNPASMTGGTQDTPFYLDFVVDAGTGGLLNVSIDRSMTVASTIADAFLNGVEIMKLMMSSNVPSSEETSDHKVHIYIIILAVLGGLALFVLLIGLVVVFICKRRRPVKPASPKPKRPPSSSSPNPGVGSNSLSYGSKSTVQSPSPRVDLYLLIPYDDIKLATNDFDDGFLIGAGGFGNVYRGTLSDGTKVAVKRGMPGSRQGYPEFQMEITLLSQIRHRHLVSLIGYCEEHSEMILVYEYMEKGTLKKFLYGSGSPCLTWKQRLEICIGACQGIHYLHTGHSHSIIHRDIKSTNILLGENYLAKVSDFGLSRLGPSLGDTHVSTVVKGSFGYMDPEYFKTQKLTDKSDVYSFGVLLFEVLCGRPAIDQNLSSEQVNLAEWALLWQKRGQLDKIVDPRLAGKINTNSLRKYGETAEKCLAEFGADRPTIADVLWNLEYALQLQETEVRREPYEDSGSINMDSGIVVGPRVRRLPSTSVIMVDEDDGTTPETRDCQSDMSASKVFSQIVTNEGR